MRLIVGLGNPGREYERTRHNAGFMVVDHLASRHGFAPPRTRFRSLFTEGVVLGVRCAILKPNTYMNLSGTAVREAVAFYKLDPDDVLVVVDDVALPCGAIRLRSGGSAGGHNGLTDIEKALGTQAYPRLRIGIDPPGRLRQADYVLGRFSPEQVAALEPAISRACDCIEGWLTTDIDQVMNRYNARAEP
jgi:PTH1 family peptidyl-tRNA hydrolase